MHSFLARTFWLGLTPLAFAHPGHDLGGLAAGFLHPMTGLDHLLVMLAVGLWAIQRRDTLWWLLPSAFVIMMLPGAALGIGGMATPVWLESAIAGSVLLVGLLLAFALKPNLVLGMVLMGGIALLHGWAHGHELPAGHTASSYMAGFALATALLHLGGVALARFCIAHWASTTPLRALGLACCGAGLSLFTLA